MCVNIQHHLHMHMQMHLSVTFLQQSSARTAYVMHARAYLAAEQSPRPGHAAPRKELDTCTQTWPTGRIGQQQAVHDVAGCADGECTKSHE